MSEALVKAIKGVLSNASCPLLPYESIKIWNLCYQKASGIEEANPISDASNKPVSKKSLSDLILEEINRWLCTKPKASFPERIKAWNEAFANFLKRASYLSDSLNR